MRTTLNIDDSLIKIASILIGIKEKTSLVRLGLEALFRKIYFSVDFLAFLYYIKILNGSGKFIYREKSEFPDRPPGQ